MRCRSITNLINRFHGCINSGVKTNGIISTCNIQINGSRKTNGIDSQCSKLLCTLERTISTDNYNCINSMLLTDLRTFLLSFRCGKLHTTGSL